jgi:hypothetical protein
LVVCIISPAFQTRPVCLTELGAAWGKIDNLFPLAVPGMDRTEMEGVLQVVAIRYIDDSGALDELHDRISEAVGKRSESATWGRHKTTWLTQVNSLSQSLTSPRVATLPEVLRLESDLEKAQSALARSHEETIELRGQLEVLGKVRPIKEVREIRLPKSDEERFETLRSEARVTLNRLPVIVQVAIFYGLTGNAMPKPNYAEDPERFRRAEEQVHQGLLTDIGDEFVIPDSSFGNVLEASEAAARLKEFLEEEASADFSQWFQGQYKGPPDITKRTVWDAVFK